MFLDFIKEICNDKKKLLWTIFLSLLVIATIVPKFLNQGPEYNFYISQASAFLHGRLNIDSYIPDVAVYKGHYFVPHPIFPAILLIPLVFLFGSNANMYLISIGLFLLSIYLFISIMKKMELENEKIYWLALAMFLGTGYWLCLKWGYRPWFFSHLCALTCLLASINESFGKGRGGLAALFLGAAFLSRQVAIYSAFFILSILYFNPKFQDKKHKYLNIGSCCAVIIGSLLIYFFINWIKFGNPLENGYIYTDISWRTDWGGEKFKNYGLFNPANVMFNFCYMFLQGFHMKFVNIANPLHSKIFLDPNGTSILAASPFILASFYAKCKPSLLAAAWTTIIVTILHLLFLSGTGWVQINTYRYLLEIFPVLIVLVAYGIKNLNNYTLFKFVVGYSIFLNIMALVLIPFWNKLVVMFYYIH